MRPASPWPCKFEKVRPRRMNVDIKVLGPGCCNCGKLEEVTRKAVEKAGIEASIEKVTDMATIMGYGVMSTPALIVDGQIRIAGRVPSVDDVVALLQRG